MADARLLKKIQNNFMRLSIRRWANRHGVEALNAYNP
jgi:hypothetical protein